MKTIEFKSAYLNAPHLFYRDFRHRPDTVLLESAEIVSKSGVQSLIGVSCALKVVCSNLKVTATALNDNALPVLTQLAEALHVPCQENRLELICQRPPSGLDEDTRLKAEGPLEVMRRLRQILAECSGIFISGMISFDYINNFEDFGNIPGGSSQCPDYVFYVFDLAVRISHIRRESLIKAFVFNPDCYAAKALEALELRDRLEEYRVPQEPAPHVTIPPELHPDLDDAAFGRMVTKVRQHIIDGDAFQVVISRTFSLPCPDPLSAYGCLKAFNPSPYMYYIRDPDFTFFGASPEFALRFNAADREVRISPIAGTRPRGLNADGTVSRELDSRTELELRTDRKETAEHLMLVDLARNDLARIAVPGSRYVDNLLHVDRYQTVMHLVSDVHATLREDLDAFHAYQACMNMGTLSGAPKHRAHEIIYSYEGHKRGSYGGVVGILDADGSFDSCIAIRSAYVSGGIARVQAGCGVVYDSDPQAECMETVNKAKSVLLAISAAAAGTAS